MGRTSIVEGYADQAIQLGAALFTPTMESDHIDVDCAHFVGRLITERWGLRPPVTADHLAEIAMRLAEAGVPDDRYIAWAMSHDIEEPVRAGIELANDEARRHAEALFNATDSTLPDRIRVLHALYAIANFIHGKEIRDAGTTYLDHVMRSTALSYHGLTAVQHESTMVTDELIFATVTATLMHDAGEKAIYTTEPFKPDAPFAKFTPLSVRHLLEGIHNAHAVAVAHSIRRATHYPKDEIWTPDYATYIWLGTIELIFRLLKFADIHDNRHIEPKPVNKANPKSKGAIAKRNLDYDAALFELRYPRPLPNEKMPLVAIWLTHYFDRVAAVSKGQMPALRQNLSDYLQIREDTAMA